MKYNFDSLKRLQDLSGLEHLLLGYLAGSINLLALDNNDCDSVTIGRLRSLVRSVCDELNIEAYL